MAADKEAVGLSRVYMYESKDILPLRDYCLFCSYTHINTTGMARIHTIIVQGQLFSLSSSTFCHVPYILLVGISLNIP